MREKSPVPLLHVRPRRGPEYVGALIEALREVQGVDQREVVLRRGPWPLALRRVGRALGALVSGDGDGEAGYSGASGEGEIGDRSGARGEDDGDGAGGDRRRAVQWPVPDRWPVVHAHGADALRAVWVAAALRGSSARVLASPLTGDAEAGGGDTGAGADDTVAGGGDAGAGSASRGAAVRVRAGPWRKVDLVAVPDEETRRALARRGVEHRRLRLAPPGEAEAALRLYRRLAYAERRRVQRVDWSVAGPAARGDRGSRVESAPPGGRVESPSPGAAEEGAEEAAEADHGEAP